MSYDVNTILLALVALGFLALLVPCVFRMNKGVVLRNLGIVMAAFALLGFFYKNFGPESKTPLFAMPESMALRQQAWQKAKESSGDPQPAQDDRKQQNSVPDDGGDIGKPSDVMKGI